MTPRAARDAGSRFARLVAAARAAGIDARPSRDAGDYLCNYAYWRALEAAGQPGGPRTVVFVHVPDVGKALPARAGGRAPTFIEVMRAGHAIVRAAME